MLPDPIGVKLNFTIIIKLIRLELYIIEVRRHFFHILKCGLNDWFIFKFIGGGFIGAPNLIQNLDVAVNLIDIV